MGGGSSSDKRPLRAKFAECLRMLLEGRISCDHVLEEYADADDPEVRRALKIIGDTCRHQGRYGFLTGPEKEALSEELMPCLERLGTS